MKNVSISSTGDASQVIVGDNNKVKVRQRMKINKWLNTYTIVSFLLGVATSLIGTFIYEWLIAK